MSHALLRFAMVPATFYHLPFQQMLFSFFPAISASGLFLLSMPTCSAVAAFSWHVVEKPVLRLRKKFSFVARARGVVAANSIPPATEPPLPQAPTVNVPALTTSAAFRSPGRQ
jgi:hypothetical protein